MTNKSCGFPVDPFTLASTLGVGFDSLLKKVNEMNSYGHKYVQSFPPYNIKKIDENKYVIEMAVAGFSKNNINIELTNDGKLVISGSSESDSVDSYLYKGIADRSFTRSFTLSDTIEIKNAEMINGMLKIFLENIIPESKKPKKIEIKD